MSTVGDLVVRLGMDRRNFTSGITAAQSALKGLVSTATTILAPLAGALALGNAVNSFRDAEKQAAKLQSVLTATGGAAGLTATEISDLAGELQKTTNFEDDATVGAAAMLATFKNIKGDTFKEAVVAAQDLATVMETDLNSSIVQVGKALNDPIKGVTALTRVGVSFTEQQKAQIKAMQESGDLMGAQQIVLSELQSEFGGAAKAVADPWIQLQNTIGGLSENIGALLLPSINAIATSFTETIGVANGLSDTFKQIGAAGGFIFENLGNYMYLAFLKGQLGVVQLTSSIAHLFTTTIPEVMTWLGGEWNNFWFTVFDYVATGFINLGENIRNTMTAVWDFIASGGTGKLVIDWKPLTEGAVNAINKLPELTDRPISAFEQSLQDDITRVGDELQTGLEAAMAAASETKAAPIAAIAGGEGGAAKDTDMKGVAAAVQGSKEAYSAIQAAVRSGEKKDPAKLQQRTNELLERSNELLQENAFEVVAMDVP